MKRKSRTGVLTLLLLLTAVLGCASNTKAQTREKNASASELVKKAAAKLKAAPGIKVDFTLTSGGRSAEGTLYESPDGRFAVTTPAGSVWYNGKSMWSYNPRTAETTLTNPDTEDLLTANPLRYLKEAGSKYTVKFLKNPPSGRRGIALLPLDRTSPLKAVTVILDTECNIKEVKVSTRDGQQSSLTVRRSDLSKRIPASQFEYPKIKYPKVTVTDLR